MKALVLDAFGAPLQLKEVAPPTVGDRVTNPFYLTCGQCRHCRSGRETLCLAAWGQVGQAIRQGQTLGRVVMVR